jgi:beta-lactam-binding protein with PASTA domain
VIEQDPGPTAQVDRGSSVDLVLAAAPADVTVPNVIGNTASDATVKLENAGFAVTSSEAESDQPAGIVIDQSPAPQTQVEPGRPINITVSLGPGAGTSGQGGPQPPPPGDQGDEEDDGFGPDDTALRGRGPDGAGPPGQLRRRGR